MVQPVTIDIKVVVIGFFYLFYELRTSTSVNLGHTDLISLNFRAMDLGESSKWTVWVLSSLS